MRVLIKGVAPPTSDWALYIPYLWGCGGSGEIKVWGMNDQRNQSWWKDYKSWHPHITLGWFQLHGLGHMVEAHGNDYMTWLSELDCPVYMFEPQIRRWPSYDVMAHLPAPKYARPYPTTRAVQLAGRRYITNTFSYQIALAIIQGATHIHITGLSLNGDKAQLWKSRRRAAELLPQINLDPTDPDWENTDSDEIDHIVSDLLGQGAGEESWAIPNIEFWIGIAKGRGVEVTVDGGQLFHDKWGGLYGYEAGGEY